jgi:hypothetical protein
MGNSSSAATDAVSSRVSTLEGTTTVVGQRVGTLENSFTMMSTRVNTIDTNFVTLSTQVQSTAGGLDSRLKTLEQAGTMKISGIDYNVVYVQNSIKAFEPRLTTVETRVSGLQTTVDSLDRRLLPVEASMKSTDLRLGSVEKRFIPIETNATLVDTRMTAFGLNLSTQAGRVGVLELSTANFAPRISTLETTVGTLTPRVTTTENQVGFINDRVATLEGLQGGAGNSVFVIDNTNKMVTVQLAAKFCIGNTCVTESDLNRLKVEQGTFSPDTRINNVTNVPINFSTTAGLVTSTTDGGVRFARAGVYRVRVTFSAAYGRGGDDQEEYYFMFREKTSTGTLQFYSYTPQRHIDVWGWGTNVTAVPTTVRLTDATGVTYMQARFYNRHFSGSNARPNAFGFSLDMNVNATSTYYFSFDTVTTSTGNHDAGIGLVNSRILIEPIIVS